MSTRKRWLAYMAARHQRGIAHIVMAKINCGGKAAAWRNGLISAIFMQ